MLKRVTITPTLDTSQYTANDVLFETTAAAGAMRFVDGKGILRAVTVHDLDDQGVNLTLYFLRGNVPFGTKNSPPNMTDANSLYVTGCAVVDSWTDFGGARVGLEGDLFIPVEAAAGSRDIYVAATTSGTPTHSASGLVIDLWIDE